MECAPELLGERARQEEAQAETRAGRLGREEGLRGALQDIGLHAGPAVLHLEEDAVPFEARGHAHARAARDGVDRVADQVADGADERLTRQAQRRFGQRLRDVEPRRGGCAQSPPHVLHDVCGSKGHRRLSGGVARLRGDAVEDRAAAAHFRADQARVVDEDGPARQPLQARSSSRAATPMLASGVPSSCAASAASVESEATRS